MPELDLNSSALSGKTMVSHFKTDPSVLFQLGEHLISDATQALLELIKNSYDADATSVLVEVDTSWTGLGHDGRQRIGRLVITDDGTGMTEKDIEEGWLTISGSRKRALKRQRWQTPRGRTPLGEKGLGRLGVQRLGVDVEIETVPEGMRKRFKVAYSWDDFRTATSLESVDVRIDESDYVGSHSTTIVIIGLNSVHEWKEKSTILRLEEGLSQLVSPYEVVHDFAVDVVVDGEAVPLTRVGDDVLRAAHIHYDLTFDGHALLVSGRVKRAFFRPPSGPKVAAYNRLVEDDAGKGLYGWLTNHGQSKAFHVTEASDPAWFVSFSAIIPFDGPGLRASGDDPSKPANPGPFRGRVDAFDLGRSRSLEADLFSAGDDFKRYVERFNGIRVYRDGFGIRTDRDWLGLADAATSGKSYYSLRPRNTMGYIAISARENPHLLEKTDREGFQITPHFDNFLHLLRGFVAFTDNAQSGLRRDYLAFVEERTKHESGVEADQGPAEITSRIRKQLVSSETLREPLRLHTNRLDAQLHAIENRVDRLLTDIPTTDHSALKAIDSLKADLLSVRTEFLATKSAVRSVDTFLEQASKLDPVAEILESQIAQIEDQVAALYETASLGITAEALSHELANIVEQLRTKARAAQTHLRANRFSVGKAGDFVHSVNDAVSAVRKQLAHLAPALRYVREDRADIQMNDFLRDLIKFHNDRWTGTIKATVKTTPDGNFRIRMNPGKLTQIFDNLVLNSEYWLTTGIGRTGGSIEFVIDQPFVRVTDSGPGIAPHLELSLFQPFVSGKPRGQGRGLGLFIVDRLLATEGCTISLGEERDAAGRLKTFELNFAPVAIDA